MIKKFIKIVGKKIKNITRTGKKESRLTPVTPENPAALPQAQTSRPPQVKGKERQRPSPSQPRNPFETDGSVSRPKQKKDKWTLANFDVPPAENKTRFHDLGLPLPIMHAIADLKFDYCTPIQEKALPETLQGKDMIGRAQTGTGKSAAFLISIFSTLLSPEDPSIKGQARQPGEPRALIIMPTRELVMQIIKDAKDLGKYTNIRILPVFGGVDYQKQKDELQNKQIDLLAATPGRLLDFLRQKTVRLDKVEVLVLDEADRMLDMGFIPDVRRIVAHTPPKEKRQTLMFSATITEEVKHLASQWCQKPSTVEIEPTQVAVDTVKQIVYLTTSKEKYAVLYNLLTQQNLKRVMVFTNRKDEARKLTDRLKRNGINCDMLSGDVMQKQRTSRLENFREGKIHVLVATDVAGRGIHIEGISHVVNYTLPYEPEDYVHRIGRTGRAGAEGISISFACDEGAFYLPDIEEYIGQKLDCQSPDESLLVQPPKGTGPKPDYHEIKKPSYRGGGGGRPRPRSGPPKRR